jgi:cytoskeletal protein RodZ
MSAPTLDKHPGSTQAGSSAGHRRRRKQLVLVASALVILALAVGTSLAIATRPVARQAPAVAGADPAAAATDQNANTDQGQTAQPGQTPAVETPAKPESSAGSGSGGAAAPALPDGDTQAYITKVDRARNRIVVDVVQVFHDNEAVKAAVADGRSPSDAKFLTTWVRNENPRLRILPLAGDLQVKLRDACGEGGTDRNALLTTLAANASQDGTYYYTLTVSDGQVQRIEERLAVNAC